jgi:hypothetical protein
VDLSGILQALASDRPLFHSEADFQFALAWHIQQAIPVAQIRLEYRPYGLERVYLDIWVATEAGNVALKLKD